MTTRITSWYVLTCCIAVLLTFFLHELAHWVTGTLLGNDMVLTLNSVYPISGEYLQPHDHMIVSAAGPLFTLLQAMVFWLVLRKANNLSLYPFLLTPLYMRFLAAVISFMNPNDEARISNDLGLGTLTIPVVVCCVLGYVVIDVCRRRQWPMRLTWITLGVIVVASSALILSDQFLRIRIL